MPFLKLTRDRRGFEHTFLMHADVPGEQARVLYWYRTAPGVLIGRPALDEEAIRSIEEQHPHIEFDWPAILALREAMPPEDETEPVRAPRPRNPGRREQGQGRPPRAPMAPPAPALPEGEALAAEVAPEDDGVPAQVADDSPPPQGLHTTHGLLEELVGREIATRLRARYAEILTRIHEQGFDEQTTATWVARAEPLDPDTWLTPDAVLDGVRAADTRLEALRAALLGSR